MMRTSSLLVLLAFVITVSCIQDETVITPFGVRPRQCVLEVPHDSTVSEENGMVKVTLPHLDAAGKPKVKYFDSPPECGNDIADIRRNMVQRKQPKPSPDLDINGWLDYGGWYPPQSESQLYSFNATYTIPGNPQDADGNQVLFYFIGMQDNDADAVNIIQPVLTWGNGISDQWYVKSWACCPSNITVSSPPVTGLTAGDQMQGVVIRESDSTWLIDSVYHGQHTALHAQVGDYNYNWADVTLEVYSVTQCNQFATGKAVFSDLKIEDSEKNIITPQWSFTGATSCGGSITQAANGDVSIQHSG